MRSISPRRFWEKYLSQITLSEKKYSCPVCRSKVTGFLRLDEQFFRELDRNQFMHPFFAFETCNFLNYSCPKCGAADRERLYALYFQKLFSGMDRTRRYRFVDFGPGIPLSKFLRSLTFLDYRTADLFMDGVDDHVDITNMSSYPDSSFDLFLCSHVLEHVSDDRKAMRELFRILKPGGRGIAMVPVLLTLDAVYENSAVKTEDERWKHFGQNDHVRLYSKSGFVGRLKEAGFAVEELGAESFGRDVFERSGIHTRSVLYVVKK